MSSTVHLQLLPEMGFNTYVSSDVPGPQRAALNVCRLSSAQAAPRVPVAVKISLTGFDPPAPSRRWYMVHSHLTYPNYTWEAGYVLSDDTVAIASWFTANGFASLGYTWANFDDCVVWGRNDTGYLIEDPQAFPFGLKNTTQRLNALGYRVGFYTDR